MKTLDKDIPEQMRNTKKRKHIECKRSKQEIDETKKETR